MNHEIILTDAEYQFVQHALKMAIAITKSYPGEFKSSQLVKLACIINSLENTFGIKNYES